VGAGAARLIRVCRAQQAEIARLTDRDAVREHATTLSRDFDAATIALLRQRVRELERRPEQNPTGGSVKSLTG